MNPREELAKLLEQAFVARHVKAVLAHYQGAIEEFQRGEWEGAISKAGKFIEAVLKALCAHTKIPVPTGRQFKVEKAIQELGQTQQGTYDDGIRLTIPRACRFAYDVASNRGGRHDPDEVDPNEMDATVLINLCAWVLAETIRFSQKGAIDSARVGHMISGLMAKRYPFIEEVDGRIYFHAAKRSARDVGLVALWHRYPERMNRQEVADTIRRHGFKDSNVRAALSRLKLVVDDDGNGNLRLLAPGVGHAEELIAAAKGD